MGIRMFPCLFARRKPGNGLRMNAIQDHRTDTAMPMACYPAGNGEK